MSLSGTVVPRSGERLGPSLSGLLLAVSFPPVHLLVPPFVALVPFAVWTGRLPRGRAGARSAARGGLLLGLVAHGLLLHWLIPALAWTTAWAPVAFLAAVGILAAMTALFGWVLHRAVHRAGAPVWLALPVAWTATEWLQGHLPDPLAFPWLELAAGLTGFPELLGLAEVVGGRGVSFWLALLSGLLAWLVLGWNHMERGRRALAIVVTMAVALGPGLWGAYRAETLETVPVARVAVVGTDVPAVARSDASSWNARVRPLLEGALERLEGVSFDLLVLPEGTVMTPDGTSTLDALTAEASRRGAEVMVGVYEGGASPRNLALLLSPDGGAPEIYRKRRLVPLVESRPPDDPVASLAPTVVGDAVYGPLICYEAIFPEEARRARLAGADVLVNVSNDAWFSASGEWGRVGTHQHAAHLVLRAVEHRMAGVRSANGGPSYVVEPTGRVHPVAYASGVSVAVVEVRSAAGRTPYTRSGDLAGAGSVLGVALLVWIGRLRRRAGLVDARLP